jgi:hypothetical protein
MCKRGEHAHSRGKRKKDAAGASPGNSDSSWAIVQDTTTRMIYKSRKEVQSSRKI